MMYQSNVSSFIKKPFHFDHINDENTIFEQSRLIEINDTQIGVVVLDNQMNGKFYKAALRKYSRFSKHLENEYQILAGSLVVICFVTTLVVNFLNKDHF